MTDLAEGVGRVLVVGGARGVGAALAGHLDHRVKRLAWVSWPWEAVGAPVESAAGSAIAPRVERAIQAGVELVDGPAGGFVDQAGIQALTPFTLDESGIDTLMATAETALGEIDAVVVDATSIGAVSWDQPPTAMADMSFEQWAYGIEHGLRSPFLIVQRAVETFLITGRPGRIVLVTVRDRFDPAAAAARTAIHSLARSVAREYGRRGILCNVVDLAPDDVAFDVWHPVFDFLLSSASSYTTGDVLSIASIAPDRHSSPDSRGAIP